jgi:hypothetical protein
MLGNRDDLVLPERWSANENAIFYNVLNIDIEQPQTYRFELADIDTGVVTTLREFVRWDEVLRGFDMPDNAPGVALGDLLQVVPNPAYDSWVALAMRGVSLAIDPELSGDTSDEANIDDVILWNYQTQQMISVAHELEQEVSLSNFLAWRPDGNMLGVVAEELGISLLRFNPNADSNPLELIKNAPKSGFALQWLGVEDLFIGFLPTSSEDTAFYIGQINNSEMETTEFVRFPYADFPTTVINLADWRLTADDNERRELSCLFDRGLPAQLTLNGRGQVSFTDGTPSRLRSAPGTDADVITQMTEGTAFTVIGEPYCADEYRWWQLQLEDGTVGYAAETSMIEGDGEYLLELL